jgi:hypothetical protein
VSRAVADIVTALLPASAEWRAVVHRDSHRHGPDDELVIHAETTPERCTAIEDAFHERVGMDVTVVPTDAATITRSLEKTRRVVIDATPPDPAVEPAGRRRSSCG